MRRLYRNSFINAQIGFFLLVLFALSGCAQFSQSGLSTYQNAFDSTTAATAVVLDAYNKAEKRTANLQIEVFDPNQAGLIARDADAPTTALLRRGFDTVETYNLILARYATGNSISTLSADLESLDHSLSKFGAAIGAEPAVGGALIQAGMTASRLAFDRSDNLAFRQSVVDNGKLVRGFLLAVRDQTPMMYRTFVNSEMAGVLTPADIHRSQANIQSLREMLAAWVLLIDETVASMEALEKAVAVGGGRVSGVAILAASTDRLARHAEEVRFARRQLRDAF